MRYTVVVNDISYCGVFKYLDLIALKDSFKVGKLPQNSEDETRKWCF